MPSSRRSARSLPPSSYLRPTTTLLLLLTLSIALPLATATVSVDKLPDCEEFALRGDCKKPEKMEFMLKNCAASCEKVPGVRKVEVMPITEDEPSFYDLTAEDVKGNIIEFEDFEGYVTLVVNCARICGALELYYKTLDHFHEIWPYSLEIVAFPFRNEVTETETPQVCDFAQYDLSPNRKIHVMKEIKLNGPDAHPVYQWLKNKFNQDVLDETYATFFLINPDGNLAEAHFGTNPASIKQYIWKHMKEDLAGRAKIGEL